MCKEARNGLGGGGCGKSIITHELKTYFKNAPLACIFKIKYTFLDLPQTSLIEEILNLPKN